MFELAKGQATVFKWKMDIDEVKIDGVRNVTADALVYWGQHRDTICFLFDGHQRCYFNLTHKVFHNLGDTLQSQMEAHQKGLRGIFKSTKDFNFDCVYKQDRYNEVYLIQFHNSVKGVMIVVTNVVFGVPSYNLSHKAFIKLTP